MADVLVIDDDPDIRSLLEIALGREGHEVQLAPDGPAGLAALRAMHPRRPVVVLDVQMPDLDGWHVLSEIREDPSLRDLAVILCTVQVDERHNGWDAGCDAYLTKPFDLTELATEVAALAALLPHEVASRREQRRLDE